MELVRRTLSLSNQPSLTEQELAQRAMDWQDALEAEVPIDRLQDAFAAALRGHSGSFPVNAFEVLMAWRDVREAERQARRIAEDEWRMERDKNLPFVPVPPDIAEKVQKLLRQKSMTLVEDPKA